ncbi:hypothetical protein [Symbiopectobacterium purcellii]
MGPSTIIAPDGCMTQILRNRRPFIDDTFLLLSSGLWNFHLRTA